MTAVRAGLRFASSVAVVSGFLLVVDVGVTLAWQEPISALVASRQQHRLAGELATLERAAVSPAPSETSSTGTRQRRARAVVDRVRHGHALGHIALPTVGRRYVFARGTDAETLRSAPGHYPSTALPGDGTTVGIAGHRTTYGAPFRTIDRLERGDPVVVDMPYGRFVYRVQRTRIVRPNDTWVVRRTTHERLVLTACHPLYSASQRIVVFATLVRRSGRAASISPASRRSSASTSAATSTSDTSTTSSQ